MSDQNEVPFFGLSANEVTDASDWEQPGVIARYIEDSRPVKDLLECDSCDDIKGRSMANFLIKKR